MEKNEKTQEVPAWIKTVKDYPEVVQQSLGNLCAQCIQNLSMLALLSFDLFVNVFKEVIIQNKVSFNADLFVKDLVNGVLNEDDKNV